MKQKAASSRTAYTDASDDSPAANTTAVTASVNQKIIETLNIKSPPATDDNKVEERQQQQGSESETAVAHGDGRDASDEVRGGDDVKDLEEWLDDFLDE